MTFCESSTPSVLWKSHEVSYYHLKVWLTVFCRHEIFFSSKTKCLETKKYLYWIHPFQLFMLVKDIYSTAVGFFDILEGSNANLFQNCKILAGSYNSLGKHKSLKVKGCYRFFFTSIVHNWMIIFKLHNEIDLIVLHQSFTTHHTH